MPITLDGTNGITQAGEFNSDSSFGFKNRIINGAMVIAQRGTSSLTNDSGALSFAVDRTFAYGNVSSKFTVQQNAGSVTPPAGFINYLGCTSSSAYTVGAAEYFVVAQYIEGLNVADLAWGTASAKTVTLSFWVRSSLTGTFGGAFQNSATDRSYPFSYTISAANTWEYKTITVAGDTSGTWLTTNGVGIRVWLGMGVGTSFSSTAGAWAAGDFKSATGATSVVGTNGATFYITGVQLEVGSTATSFDYRQYTTELALCQRYFAVTAAILYGSISGAAGQGAVNWFYKSTMRTAPTVTGNAATTVVTSTADFAAGLTNNTGGFYASFASGSTASAEL